MPQIITREVVANNATTLNVPLTNSQLDNNFVTLNTVANNNHSELTLIQEQLIRNISGLVGYWSADPAYLFEDSAGTIPASVGGVVGAWATFGATLGLGSNLYPLGDCESSLPYGKFDDLGSASTYALNSVSPISGTQDSRLVITTSTPTRPFLAAASNIASSLIVGATYRIRFSYKVNSGSWTIASIFNGSATVGVSTTLTGTGEFTFDLVCLSASSAFGNIYCGNSTCDVQIDNATVQLRTGGAFQATTANKPYLRKTPQSGVYWLDSNTSTSAITATLGNLGSACTVARSGPSGPYFLENVTISSTYNIAPAYGFGGEVAIFNRALTASEKALITRYMRRYDTLYGSLVNASPQMRGVTANTEMVPNFGVITNFTQAWRGCSSLTSFPLLDTSAGTNFEVAWNDCSSLTSFPLLDTSAGTNFASAWYYCSSLTSFPLLDTSSGTSFAYAWHRCSSLTSFPLLDTSSGTSFAYAWNYCSSLTSFPLLDTSSGTSFSYAWRGCSSLTTFPANFFDAWGATPVADCFFNTWYTCPALTQTSLNNIVASLAVSGKAAPATGTAITLDGAPLLTTMQADSAFMTAINTLKSRNWTPTYKGTAL